MTQQSLAAALPGNPPAPAPRARDLVQSSLADYFTIADGEGHPIASLLVLVDSTKAPVRAELHLNGSATDETGRQAVRQAQHLIEERYTGPEALPLQVWQSFLRSQPLQIPLPPPEPKSTKSSAASVAGAFLPTGWSLRWQPIAIAAAALVLLALLVGTVNWMRGGASETATTSGTGLVADSGGIASPTEPAANVPLPDTALTPVDQPLPGALPAITNLPTSKFANDQITIGRRVRIRDQAILTLRSEPGANAGEPVGYMENGDEATVIAGPTQLPGNSDTIVWWQVQLDDGGTAWAAANDSTMTLLDPVD